MSVTADWPASQDLRSWLGSLGQHGELGTVKSLVSGDRDVAAVLTRADGRCAVLFEEVAGAGFPLAGNLIPGRAQLARALGCAPHELASRYLDALRAPRPCVQAADAEVFACRLPGDDLLSSLPLTLQHDGDAGWYLTSGIVIVRDPASGRINLSINRMMAAGNRTLRTLVLPGRLRQILTETERQGADLDVIIAVGVDPLIGLASQAARGRDCDELEVASALRDAALEVARCPSNGLPVPTGAEFALAGRFRAGLRDIEGPFGEFPGTYGPGGPAPVIELSAVWHRPGAIFQTILSGGREHFLLGGIPREAALLGALRGAHNGITAVRLPESGSCRFTAFVAMREPVPGAPVSVIMATMGLSATVKQVVVTDDDVDIFDDEQVSWAVATRVQADRDVVVVPGARGSSLDLSADNGVTAKLGIDATAPGGQRDRFAKMTVTPRDAERLARHLAEISTAMSRV